MSKSPLFRVLVIIFIVAIVGIWVASERGGDNDQAMANQVTAKPYVEKKESPSSVATLTIDPRVSADGVLFKKLVADAHPKMAEHAEYAAETWTLMGPSSQRQLGFEIDWRVAYESDRLISLDKSTYDNGGGAHPNFYLSSLLWDKQQEKAIGLADLLTDSSENSAALQMLSANLFGQWEKEFKEKSSSDVIDAYALKWAQKALAPSVTNFESFVLIAKEGVEGAPATGLTFQYSPYKLSAYVFGSFSFDVPSSALHPYLAHEWKDQFE